MPRLHLSKPKKYGLIAALVLLAIFVATNWTSSSVRFLFWTVTLPMGLLVLLATGLGIAIGAALGYVKSGDRGL